VTSVMKVPTFYDYGWSPRCDWVRQLGGVVSPMPVGIAGLVKESSMNDTARGPREGSQFGRYYLKRLLGTGGSGAVYEAADTSKERTVALKIWPPVFTYDLVFCARLQRQARIISQLDEPHIVPIHEHGEIDGQQFLDMRLIDGANLSELLRRLGALPARRAVAIVSQVASALDAAHAMGIVHGDVKPQNILITSDDFAYLVDFGIADAAPHKGVARVIGSTAATWKYAAPERFTGPVINHQVDVYALSCVLHECLTGSPPYWADTVGALITAHLNDAPPKPSQVKAAISNVFDEVISRGMAKIPANRYPSAGALASAANEALNTRKQGQAPAVATPGQQHARPVGQTEGSPPPTARFNATSPTSPTSAHSSRREASASQAAPSAIEASIPMTASLPRFGLERRPPLVEPRKHKWRLAWITAAVLIPIVGFVAIRLLDRPPSASSISGTSHTVVAPTSPEAALQLRLLRLLPRGYLPASCKTITPQKDSLATMSCSTNSDPGGPVSAIYMMFGDTTSLRGAFDQLVQGSTIINCPGLIQSPGPWHRVATPDKNSGMLLCATRNGSPLLGWTDDANSLLGVINGVPSGPEIDQLYTWWMSHS
jgi:serine/threonine kinase PknH